MKPNAFRLVRDLCNEALAAAVRERIPGLGMANASDLSCVEVFRCRRENGDEYWMVQVQEATPEACELREFVRKYMEVAGVDGVEVQTEW